MEYKTLPIDNNIVLYQTKTKKTKIKIKIKIKIRYTYFLSV
jgi:hypothetical protein